MITDPHSREKKMGKLITLHGTSAHSRDFGRKIKFSCSHVVRPLLLYYFY